MQVSGYPWKAVYVYMYVCVICTWYVQRCSHYLVQVHYVWKFYIKVFSWNTTFNYVNSTYEYEYFASRGELLVADGSKMVEIQPIPGGTATGKPAFHIDSRTRRIVGNRKFAARSRSCDNRTNSIVFAALATLRSGPIRSWRTGKSVSMTRRCDGDGISRPIGSFSIVEGVERRMSSIEDEKEEVGGIASTAYITSHIYSKLYTANSSATNRQRNIHWYEHPLPLTIRFTLDRWKFILPFLTICWKTPRATFGRIRRFEENLF